ncbi:MAG: Gfo/Idh/MocA family oxidoreductase [Verrucomicrobiota bacterium]
MKHTSRRAFLKLSTVAGLGLALPHWSFGQGAGQKRFGPNDQVNLGIIGLGGLNVVGGVGGRGRQLIDQIRRVPGVRITALCDVDSAVLDHSAKEFKERGEKVATYRDLRQVLDDKQVDAVAVALPNHWHALATVWACQAAKHVYVEKPFAQNIWEGRQMVAAARRCGRIVQVGTQSRSSAALREAFAYLQQGDLGSIRYAHALVYRPRESIGRVNGPGAIPAHIDYDLWCGPVSKMPLNRKQLHYEWHWFWSTGNGEVGNNGVHVIDVCRWALGVDQPRRAMSVGGRFAFDDPAETPNTQIAFLDFGKVPVICEVRNLRVRPGSDARGKFRNREGGIVIDCADGYAAGDSSAVAIYDRQGKIVKEYKDAPADLPVEARHLGNFFAAVRSGNDAELAADATQGHYSATACHMANLSQRLGKAASPEQIKEVMQTDPEQADAFERCREHLQDNGVNLAETPASLGPWLTLDPARDRFTGSFADEANQLSRRVDRPPFVVPELA